MKIITAGKRRISRLAKNFFVSEDFCTPARNPNPPRNNAGNLFFAMFAAVAMVGVVGFGFQQVLKGPITGMTDVTRRTVAESTVVTSSRLAIVGATTQQTFNGDCDADGLIEPMPYRDPGAGLHPTGGGYLPTDLLPNSFDPWKSEYGYCAWDSGSASVSDAVVDCGGATPRRLEGSPLGTQYAIAIISAGKDRRFQTTCNAYVDTTPADSIPDTPLLVKTQGSDDIVLGYTYAEANDLGNGMWKPKTADPTTTTTSKSLEVAGSGTFSEKVVLTGNTTTGGGLVLPGDPGDDSLTGDCTTAVNDRQLRRNTSTAPPTIEICDFTGGLGWIAISGGASSGGTTGSLVARWKLDETSGQTADESINDLDMTLDAAGGAAVWEPNDGAVNGALYFSNTTGVEGTAPRHARLESTAITVAMWVKRNGTTAQWETLMIKSYNNYGGPTYESYGLHISSAGPDVIGFITGTPASWENLNSTVGAIPDNTWVHVVGVYDPEGAAPQKRIYINGALNASETRTDPLIYDDTATGNLFFGAANAGSSERFIGSLDDVRIYNYGMSTTEIEALYDQVSPPTLDTAAPLRTGKLFGWGLDDHDELGSGAGTTNTTMPQPASDTTGFLQIDAGDQISCGLKASGKAYCWGTDTNGRLGNGASYTNASYPVYPVIDLQDIVKVTAGTNHACALLKTGRAWCWGAEGSVGALGNGNTGSTSQVPVLVENITDFVDIDAGADTTCGVTSNGRAYCWGAGTAGQLGNNASANSASPVVVSSVSDFIQVDVSQDSGANAHVCGLAASGKAYCWGNESGNGEFGNGAPGGSQPTPQQVSNITDFVQISTSFNTTCGLRAGGEALCWGDDNDGQLGNAGTAGAQATPSSVVNVTDFVKIGVGENHACGLRKNGEMWCWGANTSGTLGNGGVTGAEASPYRVAGGFFFDFSAGKDNVLALAEPTSSRYAFITKSKSKLSLQRDTACMISDDGTAYCWGLDSNGQLGNGATTGTQSSPSLVSDSGAWDQIAVAGKYTDNTSHACAVKNTGALWCWGSDASGELGNGAGVTTDQTSPYLVNDAGPWSQVAASQNHTCAIKTDGTLWCWGSDTAGNLGVAGSGNLSSPAQITNTGPWMKVSAGGATNCAIKAGGSLWCWGYNNVGQVGDGTQVSKDVATLVSNSGLWSDVSVAATAACGVRTDGTLWCWGTGNSFGQTGTILTPKYIDAGPWASVSTNVLHTCGIKMDGSAWCWGDNTDGKLGDGTTTTRSTPTQVRGGGSWTTILTGGTYTCGMKTDNSIWCWGNDANGQLGNGDSATASIYYPTKVSFQPKPTPWIWNDAGTLISPLTGLHPTMGTSTWLSHDGAGSYGFNFQGSGRSRHVATTAADNFIISTTTAGASSTQLSLKSAGAKLSSDVTTSLVSKWTFDASGADGVGANTITMNGGPTYSSGKVSNGVTFNGTSQYGTAARSASLEPTAFTLSFWATKATLPSVSDAYYVSKSDTTGTTAGYDTSYAIKMTASTINFLTGSAGGGNMLSSTNPIATTNTWFHVVATYDSSAPYAQKKLYINGVLDNTATLSNAIFYDTAPGGVLNVGSNTGAANKMDGAMDDLRLYNRALDPGEVSELYYYQSQDYVTRSLGADSVTNNMRFSRNNSAASLPLKNLNADLEISITPNVGIGTTGFPAAKLDVNGAIKIGTASGSCSATNAGTIEYNTSAWRYCSGAAGWKPFGTWSIDAPYWKAGNIGVGHDYACSLRANGTAWCWGEAASGRLGNNNSATDQIRSIKVHTDSASSGWNDWVSLSVGYDTSCGIRSNGTAWCWGEGGDGQLGNNGTADSLRPVQVHSDVSATGWTDWVSISIRSYHACGIRSNGTAWCWGKDDYGQTGTNGGGTVLRPTQVHSDVSATGWEDWISLSTGFSSTCGIRSNGTAWCWGYGSIGQLGNNDPNDQPRPVQVLNDVAGAGWEDWVSISIADEHACGIRSNGTAWCWGGEADGSLGNNSSGGPDQLVPEQVHSDSSATGWEDWVSITTAGNKSCGIRSNGTAWCWGNGFGGALGNNGTSSALRPVQVHSDSSATGWEDWISIRSESTNTCGVRANGTAWCWGTNTTGALGNDDITGTQHNRPVQVLP